MDEIPLRITIVTPTVVRDGKGIEATTPPHGIVTTIRMPKFMSEEIDRAIAAIDPTLTKALFFRLVSYRAALEINKYVDGNLALVKELESGSTPKPTGDAQSP